MANRFWVGGTGTWNTTNTANWSATTGGASGASVPTSADFVTIDANSGGGVITFGNNVDCQGIDIRFYTGTIDFSIYVMNCSGNGFTIFRQDGTSTLAGTKVVNSNYAGATGTRTFTMLSVTEANAPTINVTAGTDIVTSSGNTRYNNLNFTGFAGTWNNVAITLFGSLTVSTGMTVNAGTAVTTFAATSGTQQITTNGKTLDFPITQNGVGGTVQLQDNLTMGSTRIFTLTAGTLALVDKTLTCNIFSSSNSNVRTIAFGTGNITVTGSGATVFSASTATNLTITGTPVVNLTYSGGTGNRQINGGSAAVLGEAQAISFNITAGTDTIVLGSGNAIKNIDFTGFSGTINASSITSVPIYGDFKLSATCTPSFAVGTTLNFAATSGTKTITCAGTTIGANFLFSGLGGTWEFADALTLASPQTINFTNGTLRLKAGVTSTVYGFTSSGIVQKNLQSTTPGVQATLSNPLGTVSTNYITIRDSNAVGGATWNAFVDQFNVDAGNNDGWDFGISPIVGGNEYTYQLRSFTQPRRF